MITLLCPQSYSLRPHYTSPDATLCHAVGIHQPLACSGFAGVGQSPRIANRLLGLLGQTDAITSDAVPASTVRCGR